MTRFKAKIWRSGTSSVVTIPGKMIGLDYKIGDDVVVELQNPQEPGSDGLYGLLSLDPPFGAVGT